MNNTYKNVNSSAWESLLNLSSTLSPLSNNVPKYNPERILYKWIVLRIVTWHIFFDIENLSDIKSKSEKIM